MTTESDTVKTVADLMAIAARTAPKAVGIDSIGIEVVTGKELAKLAREMEKIGDAMGVDFFKINGEQVKNSDACVLIGVAGRIALGANCGGCGYATCADMAKAVKAGKAVSVAASMATIAEVADKMPPIERTMLIAIEVRGSLLRRSKSRTAMFGFIFLVLIQLALYNYQALFFA